MESISLTPKEYDNILSMQQTILTKLAQRGKTQEILERLCTQAESLLPNSVATIMIKDENTGLLNVLVAPSVPKEGHTALACLKPGPGGGSCGNAVYNNEPQYVQDAFTDKRWENIRDIAYDFNLRACWSMPVRDYDNNAIGSFALSSFENRSPSPFHKKLLEVASSIVSIVLKNSYDEKRNQLFAQMAQNAFEGMIVTNKDNQIVEVNKAFETIYGYAEKDVLGKIPSILSSGQHDDTYYKQMWTSIKLTSKWSGKITNKRLDGSLITQWMSISALTNETGEIEYYLAIFSDLTERIKAKEKVEYMAHHDALTNLYNKTHLEMLLQSNNNGSLILLNIDNFSYFNTVYGFEMGDKLLIAVAHELQEHCQANNIYRINSDEFALLFDEIIDIEIYIKRIQNHFYTTPMKVDEVSINLSFTYGASYGATSLLKNSALALKQAKYIGKNRYHIFNEKHDVINQEEKEDFIASCKLLHNAFIHDTIVPFFQGIYDNKTNSINKFEVLARVVNEGKIIPPSIFLPPANISGQLTDITKIIIDKSFASMQDHPYSFSINITEDDLSRDYLEGYLLEKSKAYGIEPKRVILEILEGISAHGKQNHADQLMALKKHGFLLAIDDFGAEYSNFERVLDLDIDFLKIDAKYIKDMDTNAKSYEIAKAIAYFAKNSKIKCVAEFVHNEAVQAIVSELGIDFSQGYLFSEPQAKPVA